MMITFLLGLFLFTLSLHEVLNYRLGMTFKCFHLVLLLLVAGLALRSAATRRLRIHLHDLLLVGFLGASVLSLVHARSLGMGIRMIVAVCLMFASYYAFAVFLRDRDDLHRLLRVALFTSAFFAAIAILRLGLYLIGMDPSYKYGFGYWVPRVHGFMGEPFYFANFLLLSLPILAVCHMHRVHVVLRRLPGLLCLAVVSLAFFLTFSKSAFLVVLLHLPLLFLGMGGRRLLRIFSGLIVVICLVSLPILYAISLYWGAYYDRGVGDLIQEVFLNTRQDSYSDRYEKYTTAIAMFRDHPLLGIGPGNYTTYFDDYKPSSSDSSGSDNVTPVSIIFQLLAENGLLGSVLFSLFLLQVGARAVSAYRSAEDPGQRVVQLALLISFSCLFSQLFMGASYYFPHIWVMLGFLERHSAFILMDRASPPPSSPRAIPASSHA